MRIDILCVCFHFCLKGPIELIHPASSVLSVLVFVISIMAKKDVTSFGADSWLVDMQRDAVDIDCPPRYLAKNTQSNGW